MEVFLDSKAQITAFFGGSFDPPHYGHLALARGALASGKCGHIMWVPAFAPPHKLNSERAPFEDRMAMVDILISKERGMSVSDIEASLAKQPSYTIEILEAVEKINGSRPALLIGADSLLQLHTWCRGAELAANYLILTYPRKGYEITAGALAEFWDDRTIVEKLLSGVIPGRFFEISSSEIRNSMEKNGNAGNIKKMTDNVPEINAYIESHCLYGENKRKI